MRRLLLALPLLFASSSAFAQGEHPRAIWKGDVLDRIQAKAAAGTDPTWLSLLSSCDSRIQTTAGQPDSLPPVYAPREPITSSPPGYIFADYQGFGYHGTTFNLVTCYFALQGIDAVRVAKIKAQLIKIAQKGAAPFARITPTVTPASWVTLGFTYRPAWFVSNTGGSGQARVNLSAHGLANGTEVTISGVLGCTTANTIARVADAATASFDLVELDGVTPIICNAPGTNYNAEINDDAGYPIRTYATFLSIIYDVVGSDLSAGEKTNLFDTVNKFYDEFRITSPGYYRNTQSNYHAGYFNGVGLIGILTRGDGENPRGEEIYQYWRNTLYELQDQPYFSRWLGNSGGFPEAVRYQTLSMHGIAWTLLSQWDANGEDLFTDFPWVLDLQKYWVHNTMPPRTYLSYRGFIPSPADGTGTNPNPWDDLSSTFWIVHHIADRKGDAFRPKFSQWIEDLSAVNVELKGYNHVLFYDDALSQADWTTEPLSLAQMSNPAGGYGRVTMRSDWTTSAVAADFFVSPQLSTMGNGKERRDKGSLYVQRGDRHLLISSTAEATRANNTTEYGAAHDSTGNTEDDRYGIFWIRSSPTGGRVYQAFAGDAAAGSPASPGYRDLYPTRVVTSNQVRIDRYEDQTSYVYSRGVEIGKLYAQVCNPSCAYRQEWERELLYLRELGGKVFVAYDRTRKKLPSYVNNLNWLTGKTAVTSAYGSMYRTEVSDGAIYKGALTHALPALAAPVVTDFGNRHILFRIETAPAVEAEYVNWLTVIDAADSQASVEEVAIFATRSNIDVGRIGTTRVVGFSNQVWGAALAFPKTYTMAGMAEDVTHYLCGLAPSTTYKRTVSGNDVTIATSGGGTDTLSTSAGCVVFASGSGPPPVSPVVITTTDPLPDATEGLEHNVCLAGSGGEGEPYTFSERSNLSVDLAHRWAMDETTGNREDALNPGAGDAWQGNNDPPSQPGLDGNAVSLPDPFQQEYLSIDTATMLPSTTFTTAFWIRPTSFYDLSGSSGKPILVSNTTSHGFDIYVEPAASTSVTFKVYPGGQSATVTGNPLSTGSWHLVVVWFDGSTGAGGIRIDNGVPATFTGGTFSRASGSMLIAFDEPLVAGFTGLMDELLVWDDRILASTEQAHVWRAGDGTFDLSTTNIPAGLELVAGCLTGTPAIGSAGTDTLEFMACDAASPVPNCSEPTELDQTVNANPVSISTTQIPNTVEDEPYSAQVCATGGYPPYSFASTPDPPCSGLTFTDGSPCATITGASDTVGVCSLNVEVTDDEGQVADEDFTIQTTASPLSPITVSVRRGSNAAIVTFGGVGLASGSVCLVEILDGSGVVQQQAEVLRLATQRSAFRGLSPSTIYGARASCPGASPSQVVSFTTLPTRASGAVDVRIGLTAPSFLPSVTQVTVDWGRNSTSENTQTFACAPVCDVEVGVAGPDYYLYTYFWKNAGGATVARGNSKEFIVQ